MVLSQMGSTWKKKRNRTSTSHYAQKNKIIILNGKSNIVKLLEDNIEKHLLHDFEDTKILKELLLKSQRLTALKEKIDLFLQH